MKTIPFPSAPLDTPDWQPVDKARVVRGAPEQAYALLYSSASGEFHTGIYQCTTGSWKVSYSEDEFCTLLEGHVRLTDAGGHAQEYRAPASFLIPAGFEGLWDAITPVRKCFVTYERVK